jgi:hypothetical protein
MKIFVALWSRDTANKPFDNLGTRLWYLEKALEYADGKYKAAAAGGGFSGTIKAIFVAPEYLFDNPRDKDADPTLAHTPRAIAEESKGAIKSMIKDDSRKYPSMLIVPGTIIYRVDPTAYPLRGAEQRAKAVTSMKELQTAVSRKNEKVKSMAKDSSVPTLATKIGLLDGSGKVDYLVKNKMYGFLNGETVFSYGKRADCIEATGDVPGVFIPGRTTGIKELHGIKFGFEVCYDHEMGVLKATANGATVDIHVVASAPVTNATANMIVRAGGFFMHACSDATNSTVLFRTTPAWKQKQTDSQKKNATYATPAEAPDMIESLGTEEVNGDKMSCYVIDYQSVATATPTTPKQV